LSEQFLLKVRQLHKTDMKGKEIEDTTSILLAPFSLPENTSGKNTFKSDSHLIVYRNRDKEENFSRLYTGRSIHVIAFSSAYFQEGINKYYELTEKQAD